jgi:HAD superfamily hydrolase (TIGR01490 family)
MNSTARGRSHIAAFFDVDGTLLAAPSLERQFFAALRHRRAIPMRNYFLWVARAVRLAPQGFAAMRHANKMYLRGVSVDGNTENCRQYGQPECIAHQPRDGAEGAVPRFFPDAVEQVAWHAMQGHAIVLVSGTLAPLGAEVGLALTMRLAVRGIAATMAVCATRLEESEGQWTGRIAGDAVFGEAKGRAVRRLAREGGLNLEQCYAYGDSLSDRWMLEAVGQAVAVNPSRRLARLARLKNWSVLMWAEGKTAKDSAQDAQSAEGKAEGIGEKVG